MGLITRSLIFATVAIPTVVKKAGVIIRKIISDDEDRAFIRETQNTPKTKPSDPEITLETIQNDSTDSDSETK